MAETDVLKEFLVALGFKIDSAQYKKFTDSVTGATFNVEKLGAATAAAVIGTTAAIAKVSEVMDKLYYVSQRTGSSVSSIMSFDYGVSQLGGSADAAQASLENLGHFIRAYPGSGQFLEQLGVAPAHVKNATLALKDMIPVLKAMPQYQGLAYANMLGMDEKTFLALTSGDLTEQMDDYNARISKAGVNAQSASEKGSAFMKALRGVGAEAEVVGVALEDKLAPPMTRVVGLMDKFLQGVAVGITDPNKFVENEESAFSDAHAKNLKIQALVKGGMSFEDAQKQVNGAPEKQVNGAPEKQPDTRSADEKRKWLMSYYQSKGWSPEVAEAITSIFSKESNFDPAARWGDKGTAYGLFQAHKDWRSDYENTMGHDIFGTSMEEQAQFYDMALKGQTKSKDPDAMRVGALLKNSRSTTDAYRLLDAGFEKSAAGVAAPVINQTNNFEIGSQNPADTHQAVSGALYDANKKLTAAFTGAQPQ